MKFDMTISVGDVISLLALIAAVYIGFIQNSINQKMLSIQNNTDIYLRVRENYEGDNLVAASFEIRNISALPLALIGYNFNGTVRIISPYRLPPVSQFPDAYYYINLPSIRSSDYASFDLYFEDLKKSQSVVRGYAVYNSGHWDIS